MLEGLLRLQGLKDEKMQIKSGKARAEEQVPCSWFGYDRGISDNRGSSADVDEDP